MNICSISTRLILMVSLMFAGIALANTPVSECGISSSADFEVLKVTNDIEATSSPCITVTHENVMVDCQGHQLIGKTSSLDFAIRVEGRTGPDEIGLLNRAFNRMTGQLDQQTQALVGANQSPVHVQWY